MSYLSILVTTIVSARRQNKPDLRIASIYIVANHALSGPAEDDDVAMLKNEGSRAYDIISQELSVTLQVQGPSPGRHSRVVTVCVYYCRHT